MKILYITQFYPPETGAASTRATELVNYWVKQGNEVTVLTGFPNYPIGKIYKGFENKSVRKSKVKNLTTIRTFTYVPKYNSIILRIVNQLLFNIFCIVGGLFADKPDVVIASSPPFGIGFVGYLLSKIFNAKYIFEVRDLFPETAISFGLIKNRILIRILERIEKFYYNNSDAVVGVTESMCNFLKKRINSENKIHMITNGVNIKKFREVKDTYFRNKYDVRDEFIVMYIGIHGRAENLEVLIEAANVLKNNKQIIFIFVGDGVIKEELKNKADDMGLNNIIFVDSQPAEKIPEIIGASNICFGSRKDYNICAGALPVKIFEYMACKKPVVACLKGEAARMINKADSGICLDPNDYKGLADEILKLSNDSNICKKYGENGRSFVLEKYDREKLSENYLKIFNKIIS